MAFISFPGEHIFNALKKGVFAVNKPKDVTSVEVLEQLKAILNKDVPKHYLPHQLRLGHGGTLDQTATGVLAVAVGWGCKLLPTLLQGKKKYTVTGQFGIATDTFNETGNIIQEMKYDHIHRDLLEENLRKYKGVILQKPPKYSALKIHGKRVADLTRAGVEVEIKPRSVICHSIQCTEFSPPFFTLEVSCGGGFYVRSLINDIGEDLQSCAHVISLYRSQHGPFTEDDMLDSSLWTGQNIICAIIEAMDKYKSVLKRKKEKTWTKPSKTQSYLNKDSINF